MPFLSKQASAAVNNSSTGGGYLSLSKLADGGSVRFALLTDEPLEGYESWGSSNGTNKPFRFAEEPTYEDIKVEMGEFEPREGRGGPGGRQQPEQDLADDAHDSSPARMGVVCALSLTRSRSSL